MDELRTCGTCHEQRPLAMFYLGIERRKAAKGKPNLMWCRPCHRAYLARRRQPRADYVDRIKRENGCADCGIHSEHTEIFDLDHLPGSVKVKSVSVLVTNGPMEALVAEVAKCEVVCANCHRVRSKARGNASYGRDRV